MQQTFLTRIGERTQTWVVSLSAFEFDRVRTHLDLDLAEIISDGTVAKDVVLLAKVLYLCVLEQAEQAGISQEDFMRSLAGDKLEAGNDALYGAFINFLPTTRRGAFKETYLKAKQATEMILAETEKRLREVHLDDLLPETSTDTSLNLAGSSESTPDHIPCAS